MSTFLYYTQIMALGQSLWRCRNNRPCHNTATVSHVRTTYYFQPFDVICTEVVTLHRASSRGRNDPAECKLSVWGCSPPPPPGSSISVIYLLSLGELCSIRAVRAPKFTRGVGLVYTPRNPSQEVTEVFIQKCTHFHTRYFFSHFSWNYALTSRE